MAILLVLLTGQVVSYVLWAERAMPLTAARVGLDEVREPEFICVRASTWASLTAEQQEALDRRLRQLAAVVYHGAAELPPDRREASMTDQGLVLESVSGGYIWHWRLQGTGPFWFRAAEGWSVGNLGAGGRERICIWLLGFWVPVLFSTGWVA